MDKIKVNTLPRLTYRYTHTNETVLDFAGSRNKAEPEFSDMTYVSEGGSLPDSFKGAAEELVQTAAAGISSGYGMERKREGRLSLPPVMKYRMEGS